MSERRASLRTDDLPWVETTATVVASEYRRASWGDAAQEQDLGGFVTKFTYRVNGIAYRGEDRSIGKRNVGDKFTIRYDPSNPRYNSVAETEQASGTGFLSWLLIVLGALLFLYVLGRLI